MIKDENFISIQGWMVNLGIKGNALIAFACIYGFSQDGESEFKGSAQYIADWCGISRTAAFDVLKSLSEKKLVIKNEVIINGVKLCNYRYNFQGIKKLDRGIKKLDRGSQETCHHTISSYHKEKKDINETKKENNHKEIYDVYISAYENMFGIKPLINYPSVSKLITKHLQSITKEQIIDAINIAKTDDFCSKKTPFELATILSNNVIMRLVNESRIQNYSSLPKTNTAPTEKKKCPKCGGEIRGSACVECYTNFDYLGNEI